MRSLFLYALRVITSLTLIASFYEHLRKLFRKEAAA